MAILDLKKTNIEQDQTEVTCHLLYLFNGFTEELK